MVGLILGSLLLWASGYWVGFKAGELRPQNLVIQGVNNLNSPDATSTDFSTFWQTWQLINENHLHGVEMNNQNKVYGAIRGLVDSLQDPYSEFFNPHDSQKFQQDIRGNFGGIGAEIGIKDNQVVIIAPLPDTPASRAGLKAGDSILAINSTSTKNLSVEAAVALIRGPEKTKVTLTIFRAGWTKSRDFTIERAIIQTPTLDYELKPGNLAYLQLHSFNANAERLFYDAAVKIHDGGVKALVLDLRDDPGGYLDVAVNLAGWFLPRGTLVVSEAGKNGPTQEFRANGNAAFANLPLVILINGGSASASEILAGAIRDNRQTPLVGEKSFGKGTVQEIFSLKDDSTVKLTIAHWVLPSGKILENGGLTPDTEVKITDEDITAGRDPQLVKALEIAGTLAK